MRASSLALTVGTLGLLGLAATGCQLQAPAELTEADRRTIRQSFEAAVKTVNAKDWAGWVALYSDDAVLLPPTGQAVQGRSEIEAYTATIPPVSDFRAQQTELDGCGSVAYTRHSFSMMVALPGAAAPKEERGEVIQVWHKRADGSWKVIREMFSSDFLKWP